MIISFQTSDLYWTTLKAMVLKKDLFMCLELKPIWQTV